MKSFDEYWNDNVWGKVIAGGLLFLGATLFAAVASTFSNKSVEQLFIMFWTYKIDVWIIVVTIFVIWVGYGIFKSNRLNRSFQTLISDRTAFIVDPNDFIYETVEAKTWMDNQEVGEKALGRLEVNADVINIIRTNTDGRFVVKILQYNNDGKTNLYVKGNINLESDRIIRICFQAKVIGGHHNLRIICKKYNSPHWVHKANVKLLVNNQEWKEFKTNLIVPANEDFIIDFEDIEVEKAPSSIQIKKFIVSEQIS